MPTDWARSTSDAMEALAHYVRARHNKAATDEAGQALTAMIAQYGPYEALRAMMAAADICLRHVFDDTSEVVRRSREHRGSTKPIANDADPTAGPAVVWRKYLTDARADEVERSHTAAELERWFNLGGDAQDWTRHRPPQAG